VNRNNENIWIILSFMTAKIVQYNSSVVSVLMKFTSSTNRFYV